MAGSDVVVVRHATDQPVPLVAPYASVSTVFPDWNYPLATALSANPGQILVASNCGRAVLFQATGQQNVNGQPAILHASGTVDTPGNALGPANNGDWPADWVPWDGTGQVVAPAVTTVFYVGQRAPTPQEPAPPPSLFRMTLNSTGGWTTQELVEGVDNLQVLYGIDTDVAPDYAVNAFVTADKVTDWDRVIAVRLSLLLRSIDDNLRDTADSEDYLLNGVRDPGTASGQTPLTTRVTAPGDHRLRQVLNLTVSLRNMTFNFTTD
jgi:type IV pilus assembly protein PilW